MKTPNQLIEEINNLFKTETGHEDYYDGDTDVHDLWYQINVHVFDHWMEEDDEE
jgi:hypothetical protein